MHSLLKGLLYAQMGLMVVGQGVIYPVRTVEAASDFVYPIKQVSTVDCRTQHWDTMSSSCKIDLPILTDGNLNNFQNSKVHTDIYTTLFGASYNDWRDVENGAHPGIDIATARGTPVYSIGNGQVIFAGRQTAYGNVIKIKHTYNGQTIYSIYAHLDAIDIASGSIVMKSQQIGKVGNTGRTFGALGWYHLNFEIERDNHGRPAYFFANCKDASMGEVAIINAGACRDELYKNTIDPIAFFEGKVTALGATVAIASPLVVKSTALASNIVPIPTSTVVAVQKLETSDSRPETISKSLIPSSDDFVMDQFLKKTSWSIEYPSNTAGKAFTISLIIKDAAGNMYNGVIPRAVTFMSTSNGIQLSARTAQLVTNGRINITVTPNGSTNGSVVVMLGTQRLDSIQMRNEK